MDQNCTLGPVSLFVSACDRFQQMYMIRIRALFSHSPLNPANIIGGQDRTKTEAEFTRPEITCLGSSAYYLLGGEG